MSKDFRYSLEKGSKKHTCPECGKKSFVRYVDTSENKYLPDQYGRCDHESRCGYCKLPPLETRCFFVPFINLLDYSDKAYKLENNEGIHFIPKSQVYEVTDSGCYISEYILNAGTKKSPHHYATDCRFYSESGLISETNHIKSDKPVNKTDYFIPEDILNATLKDYDKNTFVQNILKHAPAEDIEKVISLYRLGTLGQGSRMGAVTFPFIDVSGNIRTIQAKQFDNSNHTTSTDFVHSIFARHYQKQGKQLPAWLQDYTKNDKFVSCLFGEHLLNKYPLNPVALVEAPKTAIIGTLYYGLPSSPSSLLWLAVYNKSSLTFEKCKALKGRKVVLYPDLNAFDEWHKKSLYLVTMLPGTRFVVSDILEKNATEMERNAALDLADYLIRFNYNQFRKQSIESEVEVSAVPEPPVLKDQEAPPIPVQITANENSEKQEDVKQSFFAGLNNSIYLQQPVKWDAEILSLESFFSSISLPQSSVSVSLGITIHDLPKFITGHLAILKTYNGNPVFLPYLKRLYLLQRIICSTED
jgi:hypothetical protein